MPRYVLNFSLAPIIRFPAELHNGYDDYDITLALINHPIWEAIKKASSGVPGERSPSEWILTDIFYCGIDYLCEFQA
jgi:hypothetical protein